MKKIAKGIAVVLCLTMFATMAMGSGSSDDSPKSVAPADGTASESEKESEAEESASTEATVETPAISIDEQVLVDQDGIRVTAKSYDTDSVFGDSIKLLIENSTDKDYTVTCDALIVNDYMISDLFITDVAAGKSANEEMSLLSSELEAAGIDNVGKVEIYFRAYDSDTWDDLFDNVYAEIHTSAYDTMDTTADDAGMELYNENGIRIVGKAVDEDSFWGTAILLYAENNSGRNITISAEDFSVNGFMLDAYYYVTIYDGKKSFDDITLFAADLESNGIESIENVELKFSIVDNDSYETIAESAPITFTAQ